MAGNNPRHNNAPEFESFLLGEGEKKITETVVTSMANCSDFLVKKEDHTIGNLVSVYLRKDPNVLFAAYKVAHPNVAEVLIRIQTNGNITPREAFKNTCKLLIAQYGHVGREFQKELALRQYADQGEQGGAGEGQ